MKARNALFIGALLGAAHGLAVAPESHRPIDTARVQIATLQTVNVVAPPTQVIRREPTHD